MRTGGTIKTYMICEASGLELPLYAAESIKDAAAFLGKPYGSIKNAISRGEIIERKYKVEKILIDLK